MPRESAAYLVIGATGRIGREVTNGLVDAGVPTHVLARAPEKARDLLGPAPQIVAGDLEDAPSLARSMAGIKAIYLASSVGANLVEQHARVIAAAREAGIEHIVRVSTEGVEADVPMALANWHRRGEADLERSGLAWTHIRPCNFMHNMLTFAPTIATQREIRAPFGRGRMALVDVGDIAAVAVASLLKSEHRNKAYKVTGDDWLSYDDVAATISDAIGCIVRYTPLSHGDARQEMTAAGTPSWLADDLIRMYDLLARDTTAPLTDVVRRIGGRTPLKFVDFARANAAAFLSPERPRHA